jgi:hypothetical protein
MKKLTEIINICNGQIVGLLSDWKWFMKRVNCTKPGYTSMICSNISYNLMFTTFNDSSILSKTFPLGAALQVPQNFPFALL